MFWDSYDFRAIYPTEINEDFCYHFARAVCAYYPQQKTYVLGFDARLSSESLVKSLIKGFLQSGVNVINIGFCASDMCAFAAGVLPCDGMLMLTASHNPKEYNGFKMRKKGMEPVNFKDIGADILRIMATKAYINGIGEETHKDISDDWVDFLLTTVNASNIKPLKIIADAGNGSAGTYIRKLFAKLPQITFIPLFEEKDGNFPNHHPDPLKPENLLDLKKAIQTHSADLGFAFDGDADRVVVIDNQTNTWTGSIVTSIIASIMLQKYPGKTIIQNAVSSNIVADTVSEMGGKLLTSKVGHVYIKEIMKQNPDVVFAGEHSGHYFFPSLKNTDSGWMAMMTILEYVSEGASKPHEIYARFNRYFSIDETNSKVADVQAKIAEIKTLYGNGEVNELDWLTVRFEHFWFNVRPSSNEPLLRLNMEADSSELLAQKSAEVLAVIRS